MTRCPNCSERDLGKIGMNQYYCWFCFMEISVFEDRMAIHQIKSDGTLRSLDEVFIDESITFSDS